MHIFIVHSPLLLQMATRRIESDAIDLGDVLLASSRGMKMACKSKGVQVIDLDEVCLSDDCNFANRFVSIEDAISCKTGKQSYVAYVPHLASEYAQAVVGSKFCSGYWQMEEGIGSYRDRDLFSLRFGLGRTLAKFSDAIGWRNHIKRASKYHFCDRDASKFFGVIAAYDDAFSWVDPKSKTVLPAPLFNADPNYEGSCVVLVEPVLPSDASVQESCKLWHLYGEILGNAIAERTSDHHFKRYFIKPHSTIASASLTMVEQGIDSVTGLSCELLAPHLCVEEIALAKDSLVIGVYSSTLLYVNRQGGETLCLFEELMCSEPNFQSKLGSMSEKLIRLIAGENRTNSS